VVNPILGEQRIDKLRYHVSELAKELECIVYILKEQGYNNEIFFHRIRKVIEKANADLYGKTRKGEGVSQVEEQVRARP